MQVRWRARIIASAVAMLLVPLMASAATAQTVPTAKTLSPEAMDRAWQKAAAKFEPERRRLLKRVATIDAEGPFRPDWQSLTTYRVPAWYRNAKFGIFVHWGVYSVPAFGSEWYPRNMYLKGSAAYKHELATYGPLTKFGYKDFIPMFKAQHFDPAAWMRLFKQAGARYVVPVAEHHDGFAMYASKLSDWTAAKMGPHRDVIGELARAARKAGLRFGVSYHRGAHDWFFDGGRAIPSDVNDPRYAGLYGPAVPRLYQAGSDDMEQDWTYVSQAWLNDWLARAAELVSDYHPDLFYFDWWIGHPAFREPVAKFLAFAYNSSRQRGKHMVVNYKYEAFAKGAGVEAVERGQLPGIGKRPWQTGTSISNKSWGYIMDDDYKSAGQIVHILVDVVSKNGNLLLNVGPRADGTIPDAEKKILRQIGEWLDVNGEAIYGTRPWHDYGEGPTQVAGGAFKEGKGEQYTANDIRYTVGSGDLYAIEMAWPVDGKVTLTRVRPGHHVLAVTSLATGKPVPFSQDEGGLHLAPGRNPVGQYAYAYRIHFDTPVRAH